MQLARDLHNTWIMFDHVKYVDDWPIMAYHVYHPTYCKVMTVIICDMQSEDIKVQ
jgi:hypothetical protein